MHITEYYNFFKGTEGRKKEKLCHSNKMAYKVMTEGYCGLLLLKIQ